MSLSEPRDPYSEVVDERRRWRPDWYQWLKEIVAAGAIGTVNLADSSITTAKLADGSVTTVKIADANITTVKILDANVTNAKIADNAVDNRCMADNSVGTNELVNASVTEAKLASDAGNWNKIGTWTPEITFATPGDQNLVYTVQSGKYWRLGNAVLVLFHVEAAITFTTATGLLEILNLPYSANEQYTGSVSWANLATSYTQINPSTVLNETLLILLKSGHNDASAVDLDTINQGNVDGTGTNLAFIGSIWYQTSDPI